MQIQPLNYKNNYYKQYSCPNNKGQKFAQSALQNTFTGKLFSTHYFIIPYSDAEIKAREHQMIIDKQAAEDALTAKQNEIINKTIQETKETTDLLNSIFNKSIIDELNSIIKTEFSEKIKIEKRENNIEEIPNVIMIEDPYDDISKNLVVLTAQNSECNFVDLDNENREFLLDDLWETLQGARKHFEQTKERTLIYVKDFDKLITSGENSFENIDSLKDIMCRCANDFGSTIIFRTKDSSKLVSEAIQPQRVLKISIDLKFKSHRN